MASIIASTAQMAHSAAASLLASSQIQPGGKIQQPVELKEDRADTVEKFELKGTTVIIGVPGAFTGTCSMQIPGYIEAYDQFKAKGVSEIYVVAINDTFVMKAWKDQLAPSGTKIHFASDGTGAFVSSLGLIFDATPLLGGPRAKRFVIIAKDHIVESVAVEEDPGKVTVTDAKTILAQLS